MEPTLPVSKETHASKYRSHGETFKECCNRIANELKDDDEHYHKFRDILLDMRFLPAGRVQAAMGSSKKVTGFNCFRGDLLIITSEGIKALWDVAESHITLMDGNGDWVESYVHFHGVQKVYKVKLTKGKQSRDILVTEDHEWVVKWKTDRVKTLDLKRNDKIPFLYKYKPSDPRGELHGLIYGDGSRSKKGYMIHVCSNYEETYPILDYHNLPWSQGKTYGRHYYIFGDNVYTDFKSLPEDPTPEYVCGFIRGLFLADGCYSAQPEYIISGNAEVFLWLRKYGPMAGFYVTGGSKLQDVTNYGKRKTELFNIRFDLNGLVEEDLMRGKYIPQKQKHWRVAEVSEVFEKETLVFCPSVSTTGSFVTAFGAVFGNCFVSGTIADSFVEGEGNIMQRATEAAATMRMGGGIGYDFSPLRPAGDLIRSLESSASGPISFMDIYNSICKTIASAGHRRGAQMAVLRVDHPDIEAFIYSKQNSDKLTGFNISIAITDEFMKAVENGTDFDLKWEGRTYRTIDARNLFEKIMRSAWDYAEPGILFIDRINEKNNLYYCETIAATNPCGEQPLPPFGACLLGSFNLVGYLEEAGRHKEFEGLIRYKFNWTQLRRDISVVVRAMDNVTDRTTFPLKAQREEAKNKRRMGLGVTGIANAGEAMGYVYGSSAFITFEGKVLRAINEGCYRASTELAKEKGPFPLFDKEKFLRSGFVRTSLSPRTKEAIKKNGMRNSHLTSIAPTGTISLCADNISSGIEPVFSLSMKRIIIGPHGPVVEDIEDYGMRVFGIKGRVSSKCTIEDHLNVLIEAYKWVDSSVSKTCNVNPNMAWELFKEVYIKAWRNGCKGCTIFNPGGERVGILQEDEEGIEACFIDPVTGLNTCE